MRPPTAEFPPSLRNDSRASLVLLLALAAAWGCGRGGGEAAVERRAPLVEAVAARAGTLPLRETVNGLVKARNQVEVRSEIAAPVEVPLTGEMLESVARGMPVRIEPQGGREAIAAVLSRISPFLAEESFTTIGEIDVDNRDGRLRPGMFVPAPAV